MFFWKSAPPNTEFSQVEKKIRGLRLLFCESCAEVLQTIKTFKTTCLDSLVLLQEILDERKATAESDDDHDPTIDVAVKIEMETDSDDSYDEDHDSEYNPGDEEYDDKEGLGGALDASQNLDFMNFEGGAVKMEPSEHHIKRLEKMKRKRRRSSDGREKNCHKCSECDKAFPRPANLRNHFLKKHRNAKHCKFCQKAFEDIGEFEKHMAMEDQRMKAKKMKQQKLHVCEVCGLTTKFRSNLVKHMDTHLPDNNSVKCDICAKTFKSLMLLKNHIMYHKEKTFICTTCGRKFLFAVSFNFFLLFSLKPEDLVT